MTEIKLNPDGGTITVFVPIAWRRRGGQKVIVAPPGCNDWAPPPKIDDPLVSAVARAQAGSGLRAVRTAPWPSWRTPNGSAAPTSTASCASPCSPRTGGRRQGSHSSQSRFRSSGRGSRSSSLSDTPAGCHSSAAARISAEDSGEALAHLRQYPLPGSRPPPHLASAHATACISEARRTRPDRSGC
jgi:hypothetical protein